MTLKRMTDDLRVLRKLRSKRGKKKEKTLVTDG